MKHSIRCKVLGAGQILLVVVMIFIFCAKKESDVLVKVDGSTFTLSEFKKYVPQSEYKNLPDETLKDFFDNWAEKEIIYLEAKKKGIDKEDSVELLLEQYKKNLLSMELIRRDFGGVVSEVEILEYFNQHKDEFLYIVKLGQIVLPNYEIAKMTVAEIKSGADFFKIAKERSIVRYGDSVNIVTDYLPRGKTGDFATEEVIFKMKPGDVSDPIPYIQNTYLIVKMIDKKQMYAKAELTAELRNQIYNYLMTKKYQDFVTKFVDSLKTKYKITIDLSPLKK